MAVMHLVTCLWCGTDNRVPEHVEEFTCTECGTPHTTES